jgi:hypothetical protein
VWSSALRFEVVGGLVLQSVDERPPRFQNNVASCLMYSAVLHHLQWPTRRWGNPVEVSRDGQNLIADKMKANAGWRGPVEIERIDRRPDVSAEFIPRISLRENAFRQALGTVTAVRLLHHFEH